MHIRPGVIKNYAQRHVITDNHMFAVYGVSIIKDDNIITNFADFSKDIKYFDTITDFSAYVKRLNKKYEVVKIYYVTSVPNGTFA